MNLAIRHIPPASEIEETLRRTANTIGQRVVHFPITRTGMPSAPDGL
jgi:hypothetical protein